MSLKFTKMHGLGNDFIILNALVEKIPLTKEKIQQLADRREGIGFDQLLVIEPCGQGEADFVYRIFNADGQEVEQCGNGARCVARYIFAENLSHKEKITLKTLAGKIEVMNEKNGQITVNMGRPQLEPEAIPFITAEQALQYNLLLDDSWVIFGAVSLGNPHAVLKVEDVASAPVERIGKLLQQYIGFPKQVNVGFMEVISSSSIRLRVYERGVGETRACGSGACAAVVVGRLCHKLADQVTVVLPGGSLRVTWRAPDAEILMTGPAEIVFQGEIAY
jgi:diaminopimelate epimerase